MEGPADLLIRERTSPGDLSGVMVRQSLAREDSGLQSGNINITLELLMELGFCSSSSGGKWLGRLLLFLSQSREFSQRAGQYWQKKDSSCLRLVVEEEIMLLQPQLTQTWMDYQPTRSGLLLSLTCVVVLPGSDSVCPSSQSGPEASGKSLPPVLSPSQKYFL